MASLINGTAEPPAPGVVNWMPLSVSTVMDLVGTGRDQAEQELSGDGGGGFLMQLHEGEFRCTGHGHEHVQLALFGANLGDVDVEIADRVGLELLLRRPISL